MASLSGLAGRLALCLRQRQQLLHLRLAHPARRRSTQAAGRQRRQQQEQGVAPPGPQRQAPGAGFPHQEPIKKVCIILCLFGALRICASKLFGKTMIG